MEARQKVEKYCQEIIEEAAHFTGVLPPAGSVKISMDIPTEFKSPMIFAVGFMGVMFQGAIDFSQDGICAAQMGVTDRFFDKEWLLSFDHDKKIQLLNRRQTAFDISDWSEV